MTRRLPPPNQRRTGAMPFLFAVVLGLVGLLGCFNQTIPEAKAPEQAQAPSGMDAEAAARAYVRDATPRLGLPPVESFLEARVAVGGKRTHVRMPQSHKGVPVFGAELIVHLTTQTNAVVALSDGALRDVKVASTVPTITAAEAGATAQNSLPCPSCTTAPPISALAILRHKDVDHLVWKVQLTVLDGSIFTALPVVFVDAADGTTVWSYNNLQTGTGESLYSGRVSVETYASHVDGMHHLEDLASSTGTFDYADGTTSMVRLTDADDVWSEMRQRAAVDAHFGAVATLKHYRDVYGWHGINGNGGPTPQMSVNGNTPLITSAVHYGTKYTNAFWNGSQMTYGDGDGTSFGPPVSLDIVAHEITHGLTQHTAGLIYQGESGALNESVSDVFGAMVEMAVKGQSAATWRIGEECYTPGNGNSDALRFLNNPHLALNKGYTQDDDPDHYSERYTGEGDNGGVHINSGIANFAFYLTAKGGSHHFGGSVEGIGVEAAAAIWWLGLTSYLTSNAHFEDAAAGFYRAAQELYGEDSQQARVVAQAWGLVGVTADIEAPSVRIVNPTGGSGLKQAVDVTVEAADNVIITRVELYVDGLLAASDLQSPFVLPWLTGLSGNGPHILTAKAFDGKNNSKTSAPVNVAVENETVVPLVLISSPVDHATLSGTTQATFAVTDNDAILKLHILVDDNLVRVLTQPPFTFAWDTVQVANGPHKLSAYAFDIAGNRSLTSSVNVSVSNASVANFDPSFKAPRCTTPVASCQTNALTLGRALLGPEPNQPNTLDGSCVDGTDGVFHDDESVDAVSVKSPDGKTFATQDTVKVEVTGFVYDPAVNKIDVYYAENAVTPVWSLVATIAPTAAGVQTITVPLTLKGQGTQAVRAQIRYKGNASACQPGDFNDRDDLVFEVQGPDTEPPPKAPKAALMVVNGFPIASHEHMMHAQLQDQLSLEVAVKLASEVAVSDAMDKQLVVISDTVTDAPLAEKLRLLPVPLITLQVKLLGELGMVVGGGHRFQECGDDDVSFHIEEPSSPLAAGLTDASPLVTAPTGFFSALPKGDVMVVARPKGSEDRATVFVYEAGAMMAKAPAPARRIGFFAGSATPDIMTTAAWAMFRAAATWALDLPHEHR